MRPTVSWPDFSPWEATSAAQIDGWFEWLREHAPVHHVAREGVWVVSRHADVAAALRDHRRFSSWAGNDRNSRHVDALPSLDPPEHTEVRRRMAAVFAPAAMGRWRPMAEEAVHQAFTSLPGRSFDAVATARSVPESVLAQMLDVEDRVLRSLADRPGSHRYAVLGRLVEERAAELARGARAPDADAVSMALTAGGDLDAEPDPVVSFVVLLLSAGIDTVRDLIAEASFLAATDDGFADAIATSPDAHVAGDELLRWISPLQATFRSTTATVQHGGVQIPAGAKVMLALASGNRDTAWWPGAARPQLHTAEVLRPGPHLALGVGPHRCLGAPLAHAYAAALVDALRHVRLEVAGEVARRRNPAVRSLDVLRVRRIGRR